MPEEKFDYDKYIQHLLEMYIELVPSGDVLEAYDKMIKDQETSIARGNYILHKMRFAMRDKELGLL